MTTEIFSKEEQAKLLEFCSMKAGRPSTVPTWFQFKAANFSLAFRNVGQDYKNSLWVSDLSFECSNEPEAFYALLNNLVACSIHNSDFVIVESSNIRYEPYLIEYGFSRINQADVGTNVFSISVLDKVSRPRS